MSNTFVTLIVTASMQSRAQAICEQVGGVAGADMFITGLSPDGNLPTTHYISSGMISSQFYGLLFDAELLTQVLGGTFTLAEVTELLTTSDISQDPPFDAMARLNLVLVQ